MFSSCIHKLVNLLTFLSLETIADLYRSQPGCIIAMRAQARVILTTAELGHTASERIREHSCRRKALCQPGG